MERSYRLGRLHGNEQDFVRNPTAHLAPERQQIDVPGQVTFRWQGMTGGVTSLIPILQISDKLPICHLCLDQVRSCKHYTLTTHHL